MAHRILKNAGCAPAWVEQQKQIRNLLKSSREQLAAGLAEILIQVILHPTSLYRSSYILHPAFYILIVYPTFYILHSILIQRSGGDGGGTGGGTGGRRGVSSSASVAVPAAEVVAVRISHAGAWEVQPHISSHAQTLLRSTAPGDRQASLAQAAASLTDDVRRAAEEAGRRPSPLSAASAARVSEVVLLWETAHDAAREAAAAVLDMERIPSHDIDTGASGGVSGDVSRGVSGDGEPPIGEDEAVTVAAAAAAEAAAAALGSEWAAALGDAHTQWGRHLRAFEAQLSTLNLQIRTYNLVAPTSLQQLPPLRSAAEVPRAAKLAPSVAVAKLAATRATHAQATAADGSRPSLRRGWAQSPRVQLGVDMNALPGVFASLRSTFFT